MTTPKTGRNEPCPCGSGKKYKQCCAGKPGQSSRSAGKWVALVLGGLLLIAVIGFATSLTRSEAPAARQGVWSPEHQHYH